MLGIHLFKFIVVCFSGENVDVQPFVLNLDEARQQFNLLAIARLHITIDFVNKRISRW